MAVIAIVAAGNMRCVFPDCGAAIMATATRTEYLRMVDGERWHKRCCAVTVFTNDRGLNVIWTSASSGSAVVTANAISDNANMVKHSGLPGRCAVTIVTLIV